MLHHWFHSVGRPEHQNKVSHTSLVASFFFLIITDFSAATEPVNTVFCTINSVLNEHVAFLYRIKCRPKYNKSLRMCTWARAASADDVSVAHVEIGVCASCQSWTVVCSLVRLPTVALQWCGSGEAADRPAAPGALGLGYMKVHRPWISLALFWGKVHNGDMAGWTPAITDLSSAERVHKTTHRPAISAAPWWPKAVKAAQQGVFFFKFFLYDFMLSDIFRSPNTSHSTRS